MKHPVNTAKLIGALFCVSLISANADAAKEDYYSLHRMGHDHVYNFNVNTGSADTFTTTGFKDTFNYIGYDQATGSQRAKTIACELMLVNNGQCLMAREPNGQVLLGLMRGNTPPSNLFKIWLPKGTTSLGIEFFMQQSATTEISAKFGTPPSGTLPVTLVNPSDHLSLLVAGTEIKVANAYGGGLAVLTALTGSIAPLSEGGWLYFSYTDELYKFVISAKAETKSFREGFERLVATNAFDSYGDPIDGSISVNPGGGSFTFTSSVTSYFAGTNFTLTPVGTMLSACSASPLGTVSFSVASSGITATGTVASGVAANTPITLSCTSRDTPAKGATATIKVSSRPVFQISVEAPSVAAGGNLTVKPVNGTVASCTIQNLTLSRPSGLENTFAVPLAVSEGQQTVTCVSSTTPAEKAEASVTVTKSAFAFTEKTVLLYPDGLSKNFQMNVGQNLSTCAPQHSTFPGTIVALPGSADLTITIPRGTTVYGEFAIKCRNVRNPQEAADVFVTIWPTPSLRIRGL